MNYMTRKAEIEDCSAIARIYNQGIKNQVATLETRLRTDNEMKEWLINKPERFEVIVIENKNADISGWASLNLYNPRDCYRTIADISIYVDEKKQGQGLGKELLKGLTRTAKDQGFHKLVLKMLSSNTIAHQLYKSAGFRQVGVHYKHGRMNGEWIDIILMEKLLI